MEATNNQPVSPEPYQVLMRGDVIAVPLSNSPDFNARQFWVDVATSFNGEGTTEEQKEFFGKEFDRYQKNVHDGEEVRPGGGIFAMFVKEDYSNPGSRQIIVQNRNGRGNQEYNEKMKSAVEKALTPKVQEVTE